MLYVFNSFLDNYKRALVQLAWRYVLIEKEMRSVVAQLTFPLAQGCKVPRAAKIVLLARGCKVAGALNLC